MMKRYNDAKNLFDNEEEQVAKEMMAAAGTTQNENEKPKWTGEAFGRQQGYKSKSF